MQQCLFIEPWIGRCPNEAVEGELCCLKHFKEKCSVCGEQATTRCQASIGLMCGTPLCSLCGHGEMCLHHAASGPLAIIRVLLGYEGAIPSIFSTEETRKQDNERLGKAVERLKSQAEFSKQWDKAKADGTLEQFVKEFRESHS